MPKAKFKTPAEVAAFIRNRPKKKKDEEDKKKRAGFLARSLGSLFSMGAVGRQLKRAANR